MLLAIDQGTTSTRAIAFSHDGAPAARAARELQQRYPHPQWVEHDPETIWRDTIATAQAVLDAAPSEAIGIANQRETIVLWDRATGEALHPAIVWQDRRTAADCARLRAAGHEPEIRRRTGLVLDPYFSATKLRWLLDTIPGARARADRGELAAGTIDTFLIWRLTAGRTHATDATNASRTLLYNIHTSAWDPELLRLFDIPAQLLPDVRDSAAEYGATPASLFGRPLPIGGVAGDQQAALIGQACLTPGTIKSTYGTGCFLLAHTGTTPHSSDAGLLTTIGTAIAGHITYALEGSIFSAGAAVKWLRDRIKLIGSAAETEALAASLPDNGGVYLVPAFTGLGAPHWRADTRATLSGLTLDTTGAHLVRAALESVAYQTADLLAAAPEAAGHTIRVDGGMAANDWFCQFLADVLATPVERPAQVETTAAGAARLAGLTAGHYASVASLAALWRSDRRFEPRMAKDHRADLRQGWQLALRRTLLPAAAHPT